MKSSFRSVAILVAALSGASLQASFAHGEDGAPRLVLQLTVDGLRADLLTRKIDHLGAGGFRYLLDNGVVFANAHYQHANTETIVGHAMLAAGAQPAVHGMVGNVWYDAGADALTYNFEDDDSIPDYLSVSFSGVDAVNHFFGPASLETEDMVRQLDRTLTDFLSFIDRRVGLEHTLIPST